MGSDKSHFNVSEGRNGQSHKTVSTNHNLLEEKGEPKRRYRTPYRQAKPGYRHPSVKQQSHLNTKYMHLCFVCLLVLARSGSCVWVLSLWPCGWVIDKSILQSNCGRENPTPKPLHEALRDSKGSRLGQGKSWMGQAEKLMLKAQSGFQPLCYKYVSWQSLSKLRNDESKWNDSGASARDPPLREREKTCRKWPAGQASSEPRLP